MRKLYGLVEAGGFCFKAFGVDIGVRSNSQTALERIRARLPRGVRIRRAGAVDRVYSFFFSPQAGSQRTRRFHLLYGDAQTLARSESEDAVLEEFASELGHFLAQASPTMFFVH